MRILATISVAALVTLGLAAQASAFSFNPKSTAITAKGPTTLTKTGFPSISCTSTFTGSTNAAGVGTITGATFTGTNPSCSLISATNLPWTATATGSTTLSISGVAVSTPLGACGPSPLNGTLSGGVMSFTGQVLAPNCTVSGSLTTTPTVTIVTP